MKSRRLAAIMGAALCGFSAATQTAMAASPETMHLDGGTLAPFWALPFVGLLLSIALMPILAHRLWEHHYGKFAAGWAMAFLVPSLAIFGTATTGYEFAHAIMLDYVPFIVVLFALYTISGGVLVEGSIRGTPLVNTSILASGTLIASVMGTTGASVLLIRPLLRANADRKSSVHVVVFFIFLVSNIGGSLTPIGDPPLYIGFLKGVDFFWPAQALWPKTLFLSVLLLSVFFLIDTLLDWRDTQRSRETQASVPVQVRGWLNIVLLGAVIAVILGSALWQTEGSVDIAGVHVDYPNIVRAFALVMLAAVSLALTPVTLRTKNAFTWAPLVEVALLFAAIFITIVPVLAMLRAGNEGAFADILRLVSNADGSPNNVMYFWLTGGLSSFLDNAPTYLVFFNAAGGDPAQLMGPMSSTLAAISAGAVFMGANTYIGNAPNFMVKAIAEDAGVKMPGFFGYMLWSGAILIPSFALMTVLFIE